MLTGRVRKVSKVISGIVFLTALFAFEQNLRADGFSAAQDVCTRRISNVIERDNCIAMVSNACTMDEYAVQRCEKIHDSFYFKRCLTTITGRLYVQGAVDRCFKRMGLNYVMTCLQASGRYIPRYRYGCAW